jgi:hypothetical protein
MLDRLIFAGLYRLAPKVLGALAIVKPETVIKWHRAGFRSYWRWKSRRRGGRPAVSPEIRKLIREMSIANPLWGAPRTPQARHRYRTDQRGQVHGQAKRPAIPRLEDVPSQSCRRHRRDGSVRRTDNLISSAIRLVDCGAWSTAVYGLASQRIRPQNGPQIRSRKPAAGNKLPAISFVTGTGPMVA